MSEVTVKERSREEIGTPVPEADRARNAPAVEQERSLAERDEKSALSVHAPATFEATTQVSGGGNGRLAAMTMLLCIVVPFILACIYYFAIATPQYSAETRFAVRTLGGSDVGDDRGDQSARRQLFGMTPLPQDAYIVTSFIHSPAILDQLAARIDIPSLFRGDHIDYWSRLGPHVSREELLDYWNRQVSTYIDGPSGIVMLEVRAFSSEDALMLSRAIIEESERLVNELSIRARGDYVQRAEQEVTARQADYREVLGRLNALQNETAILDPAQRASETGTLLTGLLAQKLDVDARLFVLEQQATTDSPAVRRLRSQQAALTEQIENLRSQVAATGTVDENLSSSVRRFSELETERMLASELYAAARRTLSQAQAEAIRKAVYLTIFVPPELAEESRYPRRIAMPLMILLGLSVLWGTCALIWSSVEDHRR